jgi:hypothetical protein
MCGKQRPGVLHPRVKLGVPTAGGGALAIERRGLNQRDGEDRRHEGLMAEVIIDIGGQEIASTITRASAVIDIIKASEVLIAK